MCIFSKRCPWSRIVADAKPGFATFCVRTLVIMEIGRMRTCEMGLFDGMIAFRRVP